MTSGMIDQHQDDDADLTARRLRQYVRAVASAVGCEPEAALCEFTDIATAYVPLTAQHPGAPGLDLALFWDDHHGWAVGAEDGLRTQPRLLAYFGDGLFPEPGELAAFVATQTAASVHRGSRTASSGEPRPDLANQVTVDWPGSGPGPIPLEPRPGPALGEQTATAGLGAG